MALPSERTGCLSKPLRNKRKSASLRDALLPRAATSGNSIVFHIFVRVANCATRIIQGSESFSSAGFCLAAATSIGRCCSRWRRYYAKEAHYTNHEHPCQLHIKVLSLGLLQAGYQLNQMANRLHEGVKGNETN